MYQYIQNEKGPFKFGVEWGKIKIITGRLLKSPAIYLLAVIPTVLLIYLFSVNIPFWDEWELVPIFHHLNTGHFYFHDFWQQHNEHRLLFPTLLLVGLAYITHWDIRIECIVGLFVAGISFFILTNSIPREYIKNKARVLILFLLALIWFSPVQVENWLWGWQVEWFMNVLGVMLVVYGLTRIKSQHLLNRSGTGLILLGGLLAQYSLANGTIVWPLVVLLLLYLKVPLRHIILPFIVGIASTSLYYFHYVTPSLPSKTLFLHQPLQFTGYVLGYLGRPLSFLNKPAILMGFLTVIIFMSITIYTLINRRHKLEVSIPWIFLGTYAIGSAIVTGIGRLGLGVNEALSSRYTTISSLLLVSVIILYWQNLIAINKLFRSYSKIVIKISIICLVCLIFIEFGWGVHSGHAQYLRLASAEKCTHYSAPDEKCMLLIYPNAQILEQRLQYIKSIHWAGY